MPRILGVDIPAKKKVKIALTYIYGVGNTRAQEIIEKLKLDGEARASELTDDQIGQITKLFETDYEVEGDLRRQVAAVYPSSSVHRVLPRYPSPSWTPSERSAYKDKCSYA